MPFLTPFDYDMFAAEVRKHNRYRLSNDSEAFVAAVKETLPNHRFDVKSETLFYRAQLNCEHRRVRAGISFTDVPTPFNANRMKPPQYSAKEGQVNPFEYSAKEGRVNSKGIPCLYVADLAKTAMSEVRPLRGAYVSIGSFRITRDLAIADCTDHWKDLEILGIEDQTPQQLERANWVAISKAFSIPVTEDAELMSVGYVKFSQ